MKSSSNVFYFPAAPLQEPVLMTPSRWARLSRTWWRVRFALAGIRLALRPAPRRPLFAEDEALALLQGQAEIIDRRARRCGPARVIDFDAARARLRPAAAAQ